MRQKLNAKGIIKIPDNRQEGSFLTLNLLGIMRKMNKAAFNITNKTKHNISMVFIINR